MKVIPYRMRVLHRSTKHMIKVLQRWIKKEKHKIKVLLEPKIQIRK